MFDRYLRNQKLDNSSHYSIERKTKVEQILTAFSIRRNWKTLSAPIKDNLKDLRLIEAVRTLFMFGVIHNHCAMFSIMLPSANPIFIEKVRNFFAFDDHL